MAIYHFHIKAISRNEGRNAVESAAYRRAAKLWDEKTGEVWDFTRKKGVVHSEITAPSTAFSWPKEMVLLHEKNPDAAAAQLWSMVETAEKRIDARLAREIEFSLPIELTLEQSIRLAREFITDQLVARGMVADWNIHWEKENPHVHVMLTTRELIASGFGQKVREWNQQPLLLEWRKQWADYANYHLALHRHDVRIDHRSYADQGIDLVPSIHHGQSTKKRYQKGFKTERIEQTQTIARENLARIYDHPEIAYQKVAAEKPHFTHADVEYEVARHFHQATGSPLPPHQVISSVLRALHSLDINAWKTSTHTTEKILSPEQEADLLASIEQQDSVFSERAMARALHEKVGGGDIVNTTLFLQAMIQLKCSSSLITLGLGADARERFTTKAMVELEASILKSVNVLCDRSHRSISKKAFQLSLEKWQTKEGKTLTPEQREAVFHLTRPSSIACLVGLAGAGKSFSLGAARSLWQSAGLNVIGVALAGKAADSLRQGSGIPASTLASFRLRLAQGHLILSASDVVVMDEAGMVDSHTFHWLLKAIQSAGAKLVCVGDPNQLQPIGPGAIFRALLERVGFEKLETVYRQKAKWQQEATKELARGKTVRAVTRYVAAELVTLQNTAEEAIASLVSKWRKLRTEGALLSSLIVLTHRNSDVAILNQAIRTKRIQEEGLFEGYLYLFAIINPNSRNHRHFLSHFK